MLKNKNKKMFQTKVLKDNRIKDGVNKIKVGEVKIIKPGDSKDKDSKIRVGDNKDKDGNKDNKIRVGVKDNRISSNLIINKVKEIKEMMASLCEILN